MPLTRERTIELTHNLWYNQTIMIMFSGGCPMSRILFICHGIS